MKHAHASTGVVDTVWKFFTSVRLTVVVLLTLAATSIVGTLIPQNLNSSEYILRYGPEVYMIFSILDLTDMYHSWWFRFFMAMLTMNVVICSLDRLSATMKMVFVKVPTFSIERFRRIKERSDFRAMQSPGELAARFAPLVSKKFRYVRMEKTGEGHCIFAERGRWSRLGFYFVHVSIVLLLLGGLIGSIYGFDGFVNIPEGDTVSQIRLNGSKRLVSLPFKIRCDSFSIRFYDTGQPSEYRSRLTILDSPSTSFSRDIIVNQPLRYRGINIFQSSYRALSVEKATLHFENRETGTGFEMTVGLGQPVSLPDGAGAFTLTELVPSYDFKGRMNLGETLIGQLTLSGSPPTEIILPTRFPKFDRMRQGRFIITLGEMDLLYYTGLQVTRDPGVWLVYAGFILLIFGCFVTFFMSHQRLCIDVVATGTGSHVVLTGSANKNKLAMQNKVAQISSRLAEEGGAGLK